MLPIAELNEGNEIVSKFNQNEIDDEVPDLQDNARKESLIMQRI